MIENKNLKLPKKITGKSPEEAVTSGLMYSALYSVDGIVKHIEKQFKRKFKIIISGGFAKKLKKHIKFDAKFIDDMVLKGINEILNFNAA